MRVKLRVTYLDDSVHWHTVGLGKPWKIQVMYGVHFLMLGRGIPRTLIPMENIRSIDIEEDENE